MVTALFTVMCALTLSNAEQPKVQARTMIATHAEINSATRAKRIRMEDSEYACDVVCHADMPSCGWPMIGEKYKAERDGQLDPSDDWSSKHCSSDHWTMLTGLRSGQVIKGCLAGCVKSEKETK